MNLLGIDIGTSSIKIVLYDFVNRKILKSSVKDSNSTLQLDNQYYHEQSVEKIFDTIKEILIDMSCENLQDVKHIGISGQMHGVVFWKEEKNASDGLFIHSNLITWMDQRGNIDNFIQSLPKMPSYLVDELFVSSGYGCATIFHMDQFDNSYLNQWKYAGNIVDFVACQFCDTFRPIMSSQIAHSWGYFDLINNCWFVNLLKENNFPIQFLPEVKNPGFILGKTQGFLKPMISNATVYVGMGDLQCSMFYALRNNLNAAINVSTSAQFVIRVTLADLNKLNRNKNGILTLPPGLVVNPFFNGDYLLVGASLNGGNVLANFVSVLEKWILDISGIEIPKTKIWERLLSIYSNQISGSGDNIPSNPVIIEPIIFGERHCPNAGATVSNVYPFNCNVGNIYESLCHGLIQNLTTLLPLEIISKLHVKHLTCSGGVISRHQCVKDIIRTIYGSTISEVHMMNDYDACVGVVDFLSEIL